MHISTSAQESEAPHHPPPPIWCVAAGQLLSQALLPVDGKAPPSYPCRHDLHLGFLCFCGLTFGPDDPLSPGCVQCTPGFYPLNARNSSPTDHDNKTSPQGQQMLTTPQAAPDRHTAPQPHPAAGSPLQTRFSRPALVSARLTFVCVQFKALPSPIHPPALNASLVRTWCFTNVCSCDERTPIAASHIVSKPRCVAPCYLLRSDRAMTLL